MRFFDVIAKNPEEEHVARDVRYPAMHEHGKNQREVNRKWGGLQPGNQKLLAGDWMFYYSIGSSDIAAADNLLRDGGKGVSEFVVVTELLQENKNENVNCNQHVVNYRRDSAIAIVVVKWKKTIAASLTLRILSSFFERGLGKSDVSRF